MSSNLISGRNPVLEALRSGSAIEKILIAHGAHGDSIREIRRRAREKNIPCSDAPPDVLKKLSPGSHAQGILAYVGTRIYSGLGEILGLSRSKNEQPFLLIFDEIEDPHNLGALIRTAVCLGAHGGIIPKHHSAPVNETVAKTSAGASAHFPLARVTNLVAAIEELKANGIWVVGADAEAEKDFAGADFSMPLALVIGNEGRGLRRLVKEKCDFLVRIPMKGGFDSLNASVAGALVMYEVFRQRRR